jgi:hypothetical protein
MKKISFVLCFLSLVILTSCGEKLNGNSEAEFKTSKESVEKNLDKSQKENLEKALRVVLLEAMIVKFEEPEKYKGKSFNNISMEMVDGLSYSSMVDYAEELLQNRNAKKINELKEEIKNLETQKAEVEAINGKLDLFKVTRLELYEDDFFDEQVPHLSIDYTYNGKTNLLGAIEIGATLYQVSTKKVITIQTWGYGDGEHILKPGELLDGTILLTEEKIKLKKTKYPVVNPVLLDFDLELKMNVVSLFLDGKKIERSKVTVEELDTEMTAKNEEIKELQILKGTLDELELTED